MRRQVWRSAGIIGRGVRRLEAWQGWEGSWLKRKVGRVSRLEWGPACHPAAITSI